MKKEQHPRLRTWLIDMVARMQAELDPGQDYFNAEAAGLLADIALSSGIVLVHDGVQCHRIEAGAYGGESPRSILCLRYERTPLRQAAQFLFIDAAFTEKSHRRRGTMRQLMKMAQDEARRSGCAGIALGVLSHAEAAQQFWRSLGFQESAARLELFMG